MSLNVGKYNDYKCIWSASDNIDYRLCSNCFDCDSCEYYKKINSYRNGSKVVAEKQFEYNIDKLKSTIKRLELCKKLNSAQNIFLKNNIVLKKFSENNFYLGLNPALYVLIDNISFSGYINESNLVEKNNPFFKIEGEWGCHVIVSPIKFFIMWDLNSPVKEFYGNKWIGFIDTNLEDYPEVIVSKDEYENTISNINSSLQVHLNNLQRVGETMMDGGTRVKYLYQILGRDKFIKTIKFDF